ncbi:MAG: hypothetical protein KGM44_02800 [bacterium]|nr:hypothetical protein [bacterium]
MLIPLPDLPIHDDAELRRSAGRHVEWRHLSGGRSCERDRDEEAAER